MDTLLNQFDLIANESDLAWSGQTLDEVAEQARQDRKERDAGHPYPEPVNPGSRHHGPGTNKHHGISCPHGNQTLRNLQAPARNPKRPGTPRGSRLHRLVGRLITGATQQSGDGGPEPTKGGKTIETTMPEPVSPQPRPPIEVTPRPHVANPEDENLSLTEILPSHLRPKPRKFLAASLPHLYASPILTS